MQARQIDEQEYQKLRAEYMKPRGQLKDDDYNAMRRFELEDSTLHEEGMIYYYEVLSGEKEVNPKDRYKYQKEASNLIQKIHPEYKLYEIGGWTDKYSVNAIQRLYARDYDSVSDDYAEEICKRLKTEMRRRNIL